MFALTVDQGKALQALRDRRALPARNRGDMRRVGVLIDRGLVEATTRGLVLTPLGELAVAICDKLANRR